MTSTPNSGGAECCILGVELMSFQGSMKVVRLTVNQRV